MVNPGGRTALYVSTLPPPGGGIATWTRILFERGLPGGWEPVLVDTRLAAGRRIFERGRPGVAEAVRTGRILGSLATALVRRRPAVVHFNTDPLNLGVFRDGLGARLVRAAGRAVVVHHHGLPAELREHPERRAQRRGLAALVRTARLNLAMNEPSRAFLEELGATRVVSLPNFFDETRLVAGDAAPRRPARRRVLFVGGLTRAKGAPQALELARRMPELEVHLYGAPYDEMAADLAAKPANAVVHGEVSHDALVAALCDADALLFPSEREGFPYAVLESMVCGLPVVASPVGAIPEMIVEGRGGFLRPREPEALAQALRALFADEPRRVAMGRFNQERARAEYAYGVVSRRLVALYEEIAGDAPAATG